MANTPGARKAIRKIERRTEVNKARRSRVRTFLRKFDEAVASGDRTAAQKRLHRGAIGTDARRFQGRGSQEHRLAEGLAPGRPAEKAAGRVSDLNGSEGASAPVHLAERKQGCPGVSTDGLRCVWAAVVQPTPASKSAQTRYPKA
jgi:hypothetical protein